MRAGSLAAAGLIAGLAWTSLPEMSSGQEILPGTRRGATAGERAAVSGPAYLSRALAGVWRWGNYRVVVAEDLFNCIPSGHCPFVLLDSAGVVVVRGIALERPGIAGGALIWTGPDGNLRTARPAP